MLHKFHLFAKQNLLTLRLQYCSIPSLMYITYSYRYIFELKCTGITIIIEQVGTYVFMFNIIYTHTHSITHTHTLYYIAITFKC